MILLIPAFIVLFALAIVYQTITGKEINIFTSIIDGIMELIGFLADCFGKLLYCVPFLVGIYAAVYAIPASTKYGIFGIISMILILIGVFAFIYNAAISIMCLGILVSFLPFSTNFIFGSFLFSGNTVQVDWFWNIIVSTITISIGIIITQVGKVKLSTWANW